MSRHATPCAFPCHVKRHATPSHDRRATPRQIVANVANFQYLFILWVQDELRLMKTQDAGYLTLKSQAEAKVGAGRVLVLAGAELPSCRIYWVPCCAHLQCPHFALSCPLSHAAALTYPTSARPLLLQNRKLRGCSSRCTS